ncbi:MAG: hypothetical protein Q9172_001243 [Xanthocarpia lactea]
MDEIDPRDVILWLLPHKSEGFDGAADTTAMPENKSRLIAARHDSPKQRDIPREERAGTELPAEYGLFENTNCLVFLFSHGARTSVGVVSGCAVNVDFPILHILGVSKYHFAITFDEQNRPIARDLGSTGGTKVTYNGEKRQRLSNFDWPLVGPSITNGKPPILNITDLLQFKVIVPDRDYACPEYVDKVNKFRTGTGDPENLFASLIIQSGQGTRLPSGQQTPLTGPRSGPNFYKERIGNGAFGVVIYVWNLTTREEYVLKQPLAKLVKSRTISEKSWRKEAEIMGSISHEHIVAFRAATFSPYPRLEFEYVRGGSLDNYTNLSTLENTQVLCQLSSALEYLHNRNPSIGHRDIKPENILVVHRREADGIYVKFADFGLSKAADILKTCCGTLPWAAPEIYSKVADPVGAAEDTYSVAIDIWSLGVVVASLECGLPEYEEEWERNAVAWIHAVQSHVSDNYDKQGSELLYLIIDSMLVEDPDERSSADYVTIEAERLLQSMARESDDKGSATPKPSTVGAQSAVGSEDLSENSESADATDAEEGCEWLEAPVSETRLSQVLETTEDAPQRSTVDDLLWDSGGPGRASFASSDGGQATILGTAEAAQTKDAHEEEDNASLVAGYLLGGDQVQGDAGRDAAMASRGSRSMRKRSWPEGNSPLSLPRSFPNPSSTDQQRAVGQGPPDPKRSRGEESMSEN